MFEFIKNVFKPKEVKRIPGIKYAEVSRVPIQRVEVKKFEPKEFDPKKVERLVFNAEKTERIWRYQYTDTGEILEKPASEAFKETMTSMRPVVILGFVK